MGVEGVIDKDLASSLAGRAISRAQKLIIVTSVDRAAIRFGRADQHWLETITVAEARAYLAAGEFPAGSMGPKIEAAIELRGTRRRRVHHHLHRARGGGRRRRRAGTHIVGAVMILTNARILTFDGANRVLDSGSVEVLRGRHDRDGAQRARRATADAVDAGRPAADAGPDQLPHAPVQHAGPRHRLPGLRPRISARSSRSSGGGWIAPERRRRLLQRAGGPDRFGEMRGGHGDRSSLQPECLRGQPGPHRAGFPRGGACAAPCATRLAIATAPRRRAEGIRGERPLHRADAPGDGWPDRRELRPARGVHAERPHAAPAVEANQSLGAGFHIHVAEDALRLPAPSAAWRAPACSTNAPWPRTACTSTAAR